MSNLLPPVTSGLEICLVPAGRTLLDLSGNGRTVTQAGTPGDLEWVRRNGVDQLRATGTGRLVVPNDTALQAVTDFSLFGSLDSPDVSLVRRVLYKRDVGTQLDLYRNSGAWALGDSAVTRTAVHSLVGVSSFGIALESGSSAKLYENGAYLKAFTGISTITADTADVQLFNSGGWSPFLHPFRALLFYSRVLTAWENSLLHEWSESLASPVLAQRRSYWDFGSTVPNGDSGGVVGAWDLGTVTKRQCADKSSHGNHGDVIGGCARVMTEAGLALGFDGTTGTANLGNASEIRFDSGSDFSVSMWIKPESIAGVIYLVDNFDVNDDGWAIRLVSGVPWISLNTVDVKASTALTVGVWQHVAFTCDRSGNGQAYVDGVTSGPAVDISGQTLSTANDIYVGCFDGSGGYFVGQMISLIIHDLVRTPAEIKADYLKLARKVMFSSDLRNIRPTTRPYVAGEVIPGTGYRVESGSYSVDEDPTTGKHFIECVTAGVLSRRNLLAYGTWEVWIQKAGGSWPFILPIASKPGTYNATGQDGYLLEIRSTEAITAGRLTSGAYSSKMQTANDYADEGVINKIRFTRSAANSFTAYIDGGSFTEWTIMNASVGGSNPFVDSTHGSSLYTNFDLDAGDRLYMDRQFLGEVEP